MIQKGSIKGSFGSVYGSVDKKFLCKVLVLSASTPFLSGSLEFQSWERAFLHILAREASRPCIRSRLVYGNVSGLCFAEWCLSWAFLSDVLPRSWKYTGRRIVDHSLAFDFMKPPIIALKELGNRRVFYGTCGQGERSLSKIG